MEVGFKKILDEYDSITTEMSSGGSFDMQKLGKRQAELAPIVGRISELEKLEKELAENQKLLSDSDPEIKSMALDEGRRLESRVLDLKSEVEEALLPKDANDNKNVIVEIRAGAGGDEATLFVAEMFRAYGKFAEELGFTPHIVSSSKSDAGGFKEVIFEIHGRVSAQKHPYQMFKYESGVHRVQRVPETEKSGRVHTSTVTVAVLPILEEKDYAIADKDLKIEATTSSGHGGQSVNTTYSAVRILHIPTGITAQCQDERSFMQNKEKALEVIRARVAQHYEDIENKKVRDLTKSQIGTGDRSEKIRTYNFPQDRVTDHRINQNFNQINLIMEGKLSQISEALQKADLEMKKEALKK
ncbi:MAG: peptide chain release factor 1 [Candidatus Doudnabacteria bacterium]|nr:peptide chain release factor 1 [Candidatus Doudnabacteria bacterium]